MQLNGYANMNLTVSNNAGMMKVTVILSIIRKFHMKKYHHFSITTPILVMLALLVWTMVIASNIAGVSLIILFPIAGVMFTMLSCIIIYHVNVNVARNH